MILAILLAVFVIWGFVGYNSLRKKWAGIIGVGGSYAILIGVICIVMLIGGLVSVLGGGSSGADSAVEVVMTIIVALLSMGYMVWVMLTRCETAAQRAMLPLVACLIGGGFCFRALASLVFHMPMESGNDTDDTGFVFPKYIYDQDDNPWELMNSGADNANANYYCQKTGQTRFFYKSDFNLGSPSGFHQR